MPNPNELEREAQEAALAKPLSKRHIRVSIEDGKTGLVSERLIDRDVFALAVAPRAIITSEAANAVRGFMEKLDV